MNKLFYILLCCLVYASQVYAADYYVSQNGSGSTCSEGTPCALSYANSNASAGDDVYLMDDDGNFTSQINPSNSGSDGSPITYQAYTDDTPIITYSASAYQAYINAVSYIAIDGITFSGGTGRQIRFYGAATHGEVKNCTFGGADEESIWVGSSATYTHIHDNTFNAQSEATSESTEWDNIGIYSNYNRVIDNVSTDGGGHGFVHVDYYSAYNVIRGNIVTMTDYWESATYPDKANMDIFIGIVRSSFILAENNIWIQDTDNLNGSGVVGQINRVTNYIYRKNQHWNLRGYTHIYSTGTGYDNEKNRYYHNSYFTSRNDFFNNMTPGVVFLLEQYAGGPETYDNGFVNNIWQGYGYRGFKNAGESSEVYNNFFKNNILFDVDGSDVDRFGTLRTLAQAESTWPSEYSGNIDDNPDFNDPGNKDLTLQCDSPAIDAGAWLTTITSSTGSGTTFTVADPHFFYDGWSIPGETGDIIETENGQSATITSINYSTGSITVNSSISWTQNEGIALSYNGSKPDIGAIEYTGPPPAEQSTYELDANATDTGASSYDLSAVGSPDHTSGEGVLVDSISDGYYKGSTFDSQQVTYIAIVNFDAHGGTYTQPFAGRYDTNGGRNLSCSADTSGHPQIGIGYDSGNAVEEYQHGSVMSTGTDYGIAYRVDGTGKLLDIFLYTYSGSLSSVGTDIEDQAILSGRTWNYTETDLILGVWETNGSVSANWYMNGELKYLYIADTILPQATIESILDEAFDGGSPSSPTVSSNCWSDTSGTCLIQNQIITWAGEYYCHTLTMSEAYFCEEGPATFASQVTVSAEQSLTIPYYSGYGTTSLIFCDQAVYGQSFSLQLASTNPINQGTVTIVDSESNSFDMDGDSGLDDDLTYKPVFDVTNPITTGGSTMSRRISAQ